MPVTGQPELVGRRVTAVGAERNYHFFGPASESEVLNAISGLPQSVAGFPLSQVDAEEKRDIPGDWDVRLTYGALPPGQPLNPQPLGTVEYEFTFQAPQAHIRRSLQTIFSMARTGQSAANFRGALGVVSSTDGGVVVEGFDLVPPSETFSLRYAAPNGVITQAYQLLVESMVGKVNSFAFGGRPAGSLFLTRVSGGVTTRVSQTGTDNSWNIEFGFAYSANQGPTPIVIGDAGIQIPANTKQGWHLLWTYDLPETSAIAHMTLITPHTAYVERIYDYADFRQLNLPGYTT